jgi:hypothetical protein
MAEVQRGGVNLYRTCTAGSVDTRERTCEGARGDVQIWVDPRDGPCRRNARTARTAIGVMSPSPRRLGAGRSWRAVAEPFGCSCAEAAERRQTTEHNLHRTGRARWGCSRGRRPVVWYRPGPAMAPRRFSEAERSGFSLSVPQKFLALWKRIRSSAVLSPTLDPGVIRQRRRRHLGWPVPGWPQCWGPAKPTSRPVFGKTGFESPTGIRTRVWSRPRSRQSPQVLAAGNSARGGKGLKHAAGARSEGVLRGGSPVRARAPRSASILHHAALRGTGRTLGAPCSAGRQRYASSVPGRCNSASVSCVPRHAGRGPCRALTRASPL